MAEEVIFKRGMVQSGVNLFKNALGKDVVLEESSAISTSATDGKTIYINPKSHIAKSQADFNTLLNHEEAHILFNSNKYVPMELEKAFPNVSKETVKTVYNILEDTRIEENWGKVFEGSKAGFQRIRNRIIDHAPENPIEVLAAARAGRKDLVEKSQKELKEMYDEFEPKLKELEGRDYVATFITESEVLRTMAKWYKAKEKRKNKNPPHPPQPGIPNPNGNQNGEKGENPGQNQGGKEKGEENGKQQEGNGEGEQTEQEKEGEENENIKNSEKEDADKYKEADELNNSESEVEISKGEDDEESVKRQLERQGVIDENGKLKKLSEETRKEIMQRSERNSQESIKRGKIAATYDPKQKIITGDVNETRERNYAKSYGEEEIPPKVVPQIRKILKEINQKEKEEEAMSGKRLNINRVLQKAIDPYANVKMFKRRTEGEATDFWILLDLSFSMHTENKLIKAKDALATIYDSIKSTKSPIKIRMFGFSTLEEDKTGNYPPLVFEFNRERLNSLQPEVLTPTADALRYVGDRFRRAGVSYKNLILITDGIPESGSKGNGFDEYIKQTEEEVKKLKRQGVNIFTLFLGLDKNTLNQLKQQFEFDPTKVFGEKTLYSINDSDEINSVLTKILNREVLQKLRA